MADSKRKTPFKLPLGANLVDIAKAKGTEYMSKEEVRRRAQAHASVNVQIGPSATKGYTLDQDFDGARLQLLVMSIHPYDNNPRSVPNPRLAEIKESIRQSLIKNPLIVTKRPGTKEYMLCDGGNTRLRAIQELWQETQDTKFEITPCLYREWKSESHVLVGHLIENEVRGDMTFWDKAKGIVTLKDKLEHEEETIISMRDLEGRLTSIGLPTGKSTISLYSFVVERLSHIGTHLTFPSARSLQAYITTTRKSVGKIGIEEPAFWDIISNALSECADKLLPVPVPTSDENEVFLPSFSASEAIAFCDQALAARLNRSVDEFKILCTLAESHPNATSSELIYLAKSTKSEAPIQPAPISGHSNGVPTSALAPSPRAGSAIANGIPRDTSDASPDALAKGSPRATDDTGGPGAVVGRVGTAQSVKAALPTLDEQLRSKQRALMLAAEALAKDANLLHCLNSHHTFPMGFYIEFPEKSIEISEAHTPYSIRPTVWWFLASVSGQREHDVIKKFLPKDSKWRLSYEEAPPMQLGEQEIQINNLIGTSADFLDIGLLFAPKNPLSRQMGAVMIAHAEFLELRAQLADADASTNQDGGDK